MVLSVAYHEDYEDARRPTGSSEGLTFGDYLAAIGRLPHGALPPHDGFGTLRELLASIGPGSTGHGSAFDYMTPASDVLGWVLERTTGRPYSELLSEWIWSAVGAESALELSTDTAGTPLMGTGLSMSTRDLARFGVLVCAAIDGTSADLPAEPFRTIREGGRPDVFARNRRYRYLAGYADRDQWWLAGGSGCPLAAWGIYGQVLWIDPAAGVVVACHAGGDRPSDARRDLEQDAMCRMLAGSV